MTLHLRRGLGGHPEWLRGRRLCDLLQVELRITVKTVGGRTYLRGDTFEVAGVWRGWLMLKGGPRYVKTHDVIPLKWRVVGKYSSQAARRYCRRTEAHPHLGWTAWYDESYSAWGRSCELRFTRDADPHPQQRVSYVTMNQRVEAARVGWLGDRG